MKVFDVASDDEPLYALPVALLPKVPPSLMSFDFCDELGFLGLPTRRQNGLCSYAGLLYAAACALEAKNLSAELLTSEIREQLLFVAIAPPEYAEDVANLLLTARNRPDLPSLEGLPGLAAAEVELRDWCAAMSGRPRPADVPIADSPRLTGTAWGEVMSTVANDDLSGWLLGKFAANSVVVAHVRGGRTPRKKITLSFDENIFKDLEFVERRASSRLGWAPITYTFHTPYVGATTYHFELRTREGLEVIDSVLLGDEDLEDGDDSDTETEDDASARPEYDFEPDRGTRIHRYWPEAAAMDQVAASVALKVSAERFASPAFLVSVAVALVVTAFAVWHDDLVANGTGAPSLLLLFPGALAGLLARAGGHPVVAHTLQFARRALAASCVLAFAAAGVLAFVETGDGADAATWLWLYWGTLALGAWLIAGLLYVARKLPRPPHQAGWLEARITGFEAALGKLARRRAYVRQRRLEVVVRCQSLTRESAAELAARSRDLDAILSLRVGPKRRWLMDQDVALVIPGRVDESRTLLRTVARPGDAIVRQSVSMARLTADTFRWLSDELDTGYQVAVRWPRVRDLVRWAIRPRKRYAEFLGRRQPLARGAESFAACVRSGAMVCTRPYEVAPKPPVSADSSDDATNAADSAEASQAESTSGISSDVPGADAGPEPPENVNE